MNAIVKKELEPVTEVAALIQAIERAAVNPAVDVEKMERLFALQERMLARTAEERFNASMTAAQSEMGRISADATNPQTRSNYATYGKLDKVLRPIYTRHGFALSFDEGETDKPMHVRVVCIVSHASGHSRTYKKDMPADGKGAKGGDVMTLTHASGAAQSYGMRYLLKGIFNVAIGEEDNDGNAPLPRGAKHGPRPDVSKVDQVAAQQHYNTIVDILAQDKEEKDISIDLMDVHEKLRTDEAMYSLIADKLAKEGVIKKSAFKALITMGLKAQHEDMRL